MKFATELSKALVRPARLASLLGWKSLGGVSIMALDISQEWIGVAFCGHPSSRTPICALPPIALAPRPCDGYKRHNLESSNDVVTKLSELINNLNVCGLVVGWPLQSDGRPGKPCGKVLHFLDKLACHKNPVLSKERPFVLWDDRKTPRARAGACIRSKTDFPTDIFGRCEAYSQVPALPPGRTLATCSSLEWYNRPTTKDSSAASRILKDYFQENCRSKYDFYFLEETLAECALSRYSSLFLE
mmetsp:Transcript_34855/g.103927  ORF Transcript_34855/g.103927 Transcript_34855/m.103927 type:complete len:244 (-) Transcript_34855:100-831(-)